MTRIFTDAGEHVPVTVLHQGRPVSGRGAPHRGEKNGYVALQLGVGRAKVKNVSQAERGHFAKVAQVEPKRKVAEFRVSADALMEAGAVPRSPPTHFVVGQKGGCDRHDARARASPAA